MSGVEAEALAQRHLERAGLRLLARNYRARRGELDLVMLDRGTLVVVEVRKRSHRGYGSGLESVDARKRARIVAATEQLLSERRDLAELPLRFDVVALDAADTVVEWCQAAFDGNT